VEQTAREVMRGVYGNGQVRKDQLGSRYAKVQRRVNQICRARRAR
jgi:cpl-7 lysozyme domain protein